MSTSHLHLQLRRRISGGKPLHPLSLCFQGIQRDNFNPENGCRKLLRNVGNKLPVNTALCSRYVTFKIQGVLFLWNYLPVSISVRLRIDSLSFRLISRFGDSPVSFHKAVWILVILPLTALTCNRKVNLLNSAASIALSLPAIQAALKISS